MDRYYLSHPKRSIGIAQIYKNGSTTLHQNPLVETSLEDFLTCTTRVAFVRDPISRFYSCYKFFKMFIDQGVDYPGFDLQVTSSYDTFVDFALQHSDVHWAPQSTFIFINGELIVTGLVPLKYLSNWLRKHKLRNTIENESLNYPIKPTYRLGDLREYYSKDYEVLNGFIAR